MYSEMGQKSNTMIFSDRPADINALLAQASAVMSASSSSSSSSSSSANNIASAAAAAAAGGNTSSANNNGAIFNDAVFHDSYGVNSMEDGHVPDAPPAGRK